MINIDRGRRILWGVEDDYDFFADGRIMYRCSELDHQYPGSKFICTRRDEDTWVESIMKRRLDDLLRRIPMLAQVSEEKWRELYREHYSGIENYFRGREQDVLHISIVNGEGWEKLCLFLGKEVPNKQFPHENAAGEATSRVWSSLGM